MDGETPLSFEGGGTALHVYDDRVESVARKRVQTIPLEEISEVLVSNRPKRLVIVTRQGKHHQFNIGRESEAARGAIARRLSAMRPFGG